MPENNFHQVYWQLKEIPGFNLEKYELAYMIMLDMLQSKTEIVKYIFTGPDATIHYLNVHIDDVCQAATVHGKILRQRMFVAPKPEAKVDGEEEDLL